MKGFILIAILFLILLVFRIIYIKLLLSDKT